MDLSFENWFDAQTHRDDAVGVLARDWITYCSRVPEPKFAAWVVSLKKDTGSAFEGALTEYGQSLKALREGRVSKSFPRIFAEEGFQAYMMERFEVHKRHPEISADRYLQIRRRLLYNEIKGRKIIYLDILHWVNLRHVLLDDERATPDYREVLKELRRLTKEGKIICPTSFSIFCELCKQQDERTRLLTARIMDALSTGVCFQKREVIALLEFRSFCFTRILGPESHDIREWIWTKETYILGEGFPVHSGYDETTNRLLQKVSIDLAWDLPIEHVAEETMPAIFNQAEELLAEATNADAIWYRNQNLSYDEARMREKRFLFSLLLPEFRRIAAEIGQQHPQECELFRQREGQQIYDPMLLPSLQILASATAALLILQKKKFKSNDIFDLQHAALALPYCDALFCDRPMAHILTKKPLALTALYPKIVGSSAEDILAYLDMIK